jgi:fructokinase
MQSDFVKFNDDELAEISAFMSSPYHSIEENIHTLLKRQIQHICVTKGSNGAIHYDGKCILTLYEIEVVDTVGAGDSFLAGLLSKLLGSKATRSNRFCLCIRCACCGKQRSKSYNFKSRNYMF